MKRILFLLFFVFELVHSKTSIARDAKPSHLLKIAHQETFYLTDASPNCSLNFYADVLDEDNDTSDPERKKISSEQNNLPAESFVVLNNANNFGKSFRSHYQHSSSYLPLLRVLRL